MSRKKRSTQREPNPTEAKEQVSIKITQHYRHLVEFSLVSIGGLGEVLKMYVELLRMYRCVTGPVMTEAMAFRTNYCLTLVPDIRIYPILPSTITNSRDTWTLTREEIDLLGISFEWPALMSAEVIIRAELYDHVAKENRLISSDVITLERNGERSTRSSFVPEDYSIQLSPYLYKLLTIVGLLDKVRSEWQLNREAYGEIASLFNRQLVDFGRVLEDSHVHDLIFEANVHPTIALRLVEVTKVLRTYLEAPSDAPVIKILFLASNPTDTSRLRSDREIRSIDQALRQSEFRDRFHLEQSWAVRVTDLQDHLLRYKPHIVHFSGHGSTSNVRSTGNQKI